MATLASTSVTHLPATEAELNDAYLGNPPVSPAPAAFTNPKKSKSCSSSEETLSKDKKKLSSAYSSFLGKSWTEPSKLEIFMSAKLPRREPRELVMVRKHGSVSARVVEKGENKKGEKSEKNDKGDKEGKCKAKRETPN